MAFLIVFGFLPITNWIPGGHVVPDHFEHVREWLISVILALGVGMLLAVLSRRVTGLWRPGFFDPVVRAAHAQPGRTALLLGVGALAMYAVIAQVAFSARPLLIDEVVQVWQGRVLASGRLWSPTPDFPEFTSVLHLVDHEGRRFGQFPMGGSAMLAPGAFLRAEWLTGPLFGAVSAMLAWMVFRRIEPRAAVALSAALLFALSPFTAFMAGSHMNHATALTWLMLAMLGLAWATGSGSPHWGYGLLCGLGLGMAATIRPLDAMAFGAPAGAWLFWRAGRSRQFTHLLASGVGVLIPTGLLLAANHLTTGHAFVFGYDVLWGSGVGLGFHQPPWGPVHTPARGIEQISLYLSSLQAYLLEAGMPALLPIIVALALHGRLQAFDRYLLLASGLLLFGYAGYWHDGFYLGPRFVYSLIPVLVLWLARLVSAIGARGGELAFRATAFAIVPVGLTALFHGVPQRLNEYRQIPRGMDREAEALLEQAGVSDGVVLVRGTWGDEVQARLIGAGVRRRDVERAYRNTDICVLDRAMLELEEAILPPDSALRVLEPLMGDSGRLVWQVGLSPDPTVRFLPGTTYSARCQSRLADDQTGPISYLPFFLASRPGATFMRDLRERNEVVVDQRGSRAFHRLLVVPRDSGRALGLFTLHQDSL